MNRDIGFLVRPILALALLAFIVSTTLQSLRDAGAYGGHRAKRSQTQVADPFLPLDQALAAEPLPPPAPTRDPFGYGAAPVSHTVSRPTRPKPVVRVEPPRPIVTAIVFDNDPRAVIRWKDRDWTVRSGGLFDEFTVVTITREQVTLRHGAETMTLKRPSKGE